jgi:tetratricopeptide (TPR) repeat protein
MADKPPPKLPRVTPEQRRAAAGQFERANQVLAKGDFDYALPLLLNCCVIDPGNPVYRQVLHKAARDKYGNAKRGQKLAFLTNISPKLQLRKAQLAGNHLKALECAEQILVRNPWDIAAHLAMAAAFQELELNDLAIWTLEQARQADGNDAQVNRFLARLYEKRGNFNQAIALWQLVRKADPTDQEASNKAKDLAASATIARGRYQEVIDGGAPTPMTKAPAPDTMIAAPALDQTPICDSPAVQGPRLGKPEQWRPSPAPSAAPATMPASAPAPAVAPAGAAPAGVESINDHRIREAPALQAKIRANPTNPMGYIHLAQLYRRAERFDEARAVLAEGLTATHNHFDVGLELVDLDIEPFRRDLAIADEELRRQPDRADLQKTRKTLEKEISARELDYYRKKAERFPTDTASRFEMSLRLMKVGQTDEAIKELQGLRADPRHQCKVLVYLGFCFRARNNWRLAQRNFEEALQHLGPHDEGLRKEVLYQLAQGYAESGEIVRAVDLACELANLDFAYKNISQLMDQWQARLQKA